MKYGQWISVTERLPDKYARILAYCPDLESTDVGAISVQTGWMCKSKCANITYWMPLPELPSDKKETSVLQTIYDTPETCPNCMEHLSLEWAYCPECGRPTDWNKNKKLYDCIEGMCCDCTHGNGKCCEEYANGL